MSHAQIFCVIVAGTELTHVTVQYRTFVKKVVDIHITDRTKIYISTKHISRIKKNPRGTESTELNVAQISAACCTTCYFRMHIQFKVAYNFDFTYDLARIVQTEKYCVLLVDSLYRIFL
jgi:hypothetical protein